MVHMGFEDVPNISAHECSNQPNIPAALDDIPDCSSWFLFRRTVSWETQDH